MKRKYLTIGITVLFATIVLSPSLSAYNESILSKIFSPPQNKEKVTISVFVYKADGIVENSMVKMSHEQMEQFNAELNETNNNITLQLSIYKKYKLIPEKITWDTLQERTKENAQRLGLTQQKLEHIASSDMNDFLKQKNQKNQGNKIYINILCKFSGRFGFQSVILPIKLATFMVLFYITGYKIRTFNLRDRIICFDGALITVGDGLLPDFRVWLKDSFTKIIGFIGFIFCSYSFWYCMGFAAYFRTFGTEYEKLNT